MKRGRANSNLAHRDKRIVGNGTRTAVNFILMVFLCNFSFSSTERMGEKPCSYTSKSTKKCEIFI